MKPIFTNICSGAIFGLMLTMPICAVAQQSEPNGSADKTSQPIPTGWLKASASAMHVGTTPTLQWNISYPSIVEDFITIEEPSTISADRPVDYEIRVLGAGVTVTRNNGKSFEFVPTKTSVNVGNTGYTQIFYGTNNDVRPGDVVNQGSMMPNETMKFSGQYFFNNSWGPLHTSDDHTMNIRTLVNGDVPPDKVPDYNAPSLESFIKPYLSATGKVDIGPMDCIVFMELTHQDSQMSNPGYDLQDMVLLITFQETAISDTPGNGNGRSNNGHGNNVDGIDSSNPGNAPFMDQDTDPTVDDEIDKSGNGNGNGNGNGQP